MHSTCDAVAQRLELAPDVVSGPAADAGVDLVEDERPALPCRDGQGAEREHHALGADKEPVEARCRPSCA